jgi:hypothetical protein
MMNSDLRLTPEEAALVENSSWIFTKHSIIQKVYALFGELSASYGNLLSEYTALIPKEVTAVSPKIYRGEQYRKLPYVMLDHPRFFQQQDTFAIRNFFWWGNHFSIHLILSGKYRKLFEAGIARHISNGKLNSWFVGIAEDPWHHHFEADNYLPLSDIKTENILSGRNHLKLARWHPLNEWDTVLSFFITSYKELLASMKY